ncbi:MAG: Hsp20/alpha crystallin family protein [Candidatus Heimdallarchaeota archaeon]|nr:MAG: Hsp20/alpha crystallin family protein [Candidatus Heimdallarchaeota archaeon]
MAVDDLFWWNWSVYPYFDLSDRIYIDKKNNTVLELLVPGFNKETLNVFLENDKFIIVDGKIGNRELHKEFSVNNGVKSENISATLKNGVLTIVIVRSKEMDLKRISIND